jgi:hypothetical protein
MKARFGFVLIMCLGGAVHAQEALQPVDPYESYGRPYDRPATSVVEAQVMDPYAPAQAVVVPPAAPLPPPPPAYPRGYSAFPTSPPPGCCCTCGCCAPNYGAPYQSGCAPRCAAPPPPTYPVYPPYPPPVYIPYPPPPYPPRFVPPIVRPRLIIPRPQPQWDGVRRFSIGVHGTVFGIDQQIGADTLVLGGAGLQMRFRSKGRFGFELHQSFLYANYAHGNFVRKSYPFQASLLFYVFPNQDSRHFNLYALAGAGVVPDRVRVLDPRNTRTEQSFLEWDGHLGLGLELRWRWFSLAADARAVGLLRDNSGTPAVFYTGISGGPVPEKSWGIMGNAYLSFWF